MGATGTSSFKVLTVKMGVCIAHQMLSTPMVCHHTETHQNRGVLAYLVYCCIAIKYILLPIVHGSPCGKNKKVCQSHQCGVIGIPLSFSMPYCWCAKHTYSGVI